MNKDMQNLVIERVKAISGNLHLHVGGFDRVALTKEEIIKNITNNTEIGQKLVKHQIAYIQATASGKIYQALKNE